MKSSWTETKLNSKYHFDTTVVDGRFDSVVQLGKINPVWTRDIEKIIDDSRPSTWRTRGNPEDPLKRDTDEFIQEEYDLDRIGIGKNHIVSNISHTIPDSLLPAINLFALEKCSSRLHVQYPGQVWNLHIDKLQKWNPEDPSKVVRILIHLTDWQPGHFWSYGNIVHTGWRSGDITSFDWQNTPHSTANAGHTPRITLQITGVKTEKTNIYLHQLKTTINSIQ